MNNTDELTDHLDNLEKNFQKLLEISINLNLQLPEFIAKAEYHYKNKKSSAEYQNKMRSKLKDIGFHSSNLLIAIADFYMTDLDGDMKQHKEKYGK